MFLLSKKRYKYLKPKIVALKESNERKRELLKELALAMNIKKPTTSKLLLWMVVSYVFESTAFCQYMILKTNDTSCLSIVYSNAFTLVITVLGYFFKSGKQNSVGGITYETAMLELKNSQNSTEAVG